MPGWLQKLRKKSPKTRHRIALGTSVSVTCLIFVMWVTVLNYGVENEVESLQAGDSTNQTASPLSAFGNNAASAFKQLKQGFGTMGNKAPVSADEVGQQQDDDNFWGDQESSGSDYGQKDATTSTAKSEEPFTSRNYNPSSESGWFSE
jgi:hypothetical protein